jgi:hypothetical protein
MQDEGTCFESDISGISDISDIGPAVLPFSSGMHLVLMC